MNKEKDNSLLFRENWRIEQERLRSKLITSTDLNLDEVKYIGSFGFYPDCISHLCSVTLLIFKVEGDEERQNTKYKLNLVYEDNIIEDLNEEYVRGYFAYQVFPHIERIYQRYIATIGDNNNNNNNNKNKLQFDVGIPDFWFVNGQGTLHPRGFGVACHMGVMLNISVIGVGNSLLKIHGVNKAQIENEFKRLHEKKKTAFEYIELRDNEKNIIGAAVRPLTLIHSPIYVSPGHKMDLITALEIVKRTSYYRMPEPIRLAEIKSKEYMKKHLNEIYQEDAHGL